MRSLTSKKRDVILGAAAAVFARKGYQRTLVDDVARSAGVGKGTVYRYFRDKEDLFFSIIDQGVARLIAAMEAASRSGKGPVDSLRGIFGAVAEFTSENKPLFKLLYQVEARERIRHFQRIHGQNNRILSITERVLRDGMRRGAFRRGDARLWARAVATMARAAYIDCPRGSWEKVTGSMMDLVLNGLAGSRETKGPRAA